MSKQSKPKSETKKKHGYHEFYKIVKTNLITDKTLVPSIIKEPDVILCSSDMTKLFTMNVTSKSTLDDKRNSN